MKKCSIILKKVKALPFWNETNRGLSLIETVIYIAILAILFVTVANTAILVSGSFGKARALRNVSVGGGGALERIVREIRLAQSVDDAGSVFGEHPGVLRLNTTISPDDATPITRTFFLNAESSRVMMQEGSAEGRAITPPGNITNLVFYKTEHGSRSDGVVIRLTFGGGISGTGPQESFYATIVLLM